MTRLTDGKRTVEITMNHWESKNPGYSPDWSADFFEVGALQRDEQKGAYIVEDVQYCIEQANDWKEYTGDFHDLEAKEAEAESGMERCVTIE